MPRKVVVSEIESDSSISISYDYNITSLSENEILAIQFLILIIHDLP